MLVLASCGLIAAGGGCYHGTARDVSPRDLTREKGWVTVDGMRLIRQNQARECGAAALAMMLQRWSVPTSQEEILRAVPVDPVHGISAGALRDFARSKGLQAFLIRGDMKDLVKEVSLNRPVMVGLVQRYGGDKALSHFEVVAGINSTARRLLLLDPGRGFREDGFEGFAVEWIGADRVALVIVPS